MNFYILSIILILVCFVAIRTIHNRRSLILTILIILSIGLYLGVQEETEPTYIKITGNQTNITGSSNILQINKDTFIQCPQDQKIQLSSKPNQTTTTKIVYDPVTNQSYIASNTTNQSHFVCFNPTPGGHIQITTPQLAFFLYTILILGGMTLHGLRNLYSSKIYIYENKYQEELRPISKIADTFRQKGYRWTWSGYSFLVESRSNELYVSTDELSDEIDKIFVMKGSVLRVDHQALYIYLNKDLKLMREILKNPKLSLINGRIDNFDPNIKLYVNIPLKGEKAYTFLSLKGKYDFTADRFLVTIRDLFKLLIGSQESYTDTLEANVRMVNDTTKIAQGTAVISDAYNRTKKSRVVSPEQYQQQEQQRKEM